MKNISIAIDGPSGAGKSTIAKMTADKFGFIYVDTGALYRCVGLYVKQKNIDANDSARVAEALLDIRIGLEYDDAGFQRMYLNGDDVSYEIRLPEISLLASKVSAMPQVRAFLLDTQREMAKKYNVIMDGRDIGTVVLPGANIKIFLTATPEDRAKRRYDELTLKGVETTFEDVLRDVICRDKNDSSRDIAPLKPAKDAIIVDTTGNTLEKSFNVITEIIKERLKNEQ